LAKRVEIGFSVLILGLILTVSAYAFSFILTNYTDYCIVDGILDSINETKLENCISENSDWKMLTYYIGFVGIILLAIAAVLFAKISFKKSNSTETNISKNSNFDTKIVAIGLAVFAGLAYIRIFEYEIFGGVILVTIPSLVGLFGSKWITQTWQERSTKIKMRKEVLEAFGNSTIQYKNAIHQFIETFLETYGKRDFKKYSKEKGVSTFDMTFPTEEHLKPRVLLKEEIHNLKQQMNSCKIVNEPNFISLFRLYYRDNEVEKLFHEIEKSLVLMKNAVFALIDAESLEVVKKTESVYREAYKETMKVIKKFTKNLTEKEIYID